MENFCDFFDNKMMEIVLPSLAITFLVSYAMRYKILTAFRKHFPEAFGQAMESVGREKDDTTISIGFIHILYEQIYSHMPKSGKNIYGVAHRVQSVLEIVWLSLLLLEFLNIISKPICG